MREKHTHTHTVGRRPAESLYDEIQYGELIPSIYLSPAVLSHPLLPTLSPKYRNGTQCIDTRWSKILSYVYVHKDSLLPLFPIARPLPAILLPLSHPSLSFSLSPFFCLIFFFLFNIVAQHQAWGRRAESDRVREWKERKGMKEWREGESECEKSMSAIKVAARWTLPAARFKLNSACKFQAGDFCTGQAMCKPV